jgi:hypothetical protein
MGHDNIHRRYFGGWSNKFTRISQAGVIDSSFIPTPIDNGPDGDVTGFAVDNLAGVIYVSGVFTKWGGFPTPGGICRINITDGLVDTSFQVPPILSFTSSPLTVAGYPVVLDRNSNNEVTAIYAHCRHTPTDSERVIKFYPDGTIDTRFASPLGMQRVHLAIRHGYLVVMSYTGHPQLDRVNNFWNSTSVDGYDSLFRNFAIILDKVTGAPYWVFNSDPDYIPSGVSDFTKTNPGYFNGPITGVR